jgi:dolichol kinase
MSYKAFVVQYLFFSNKFYFFFTLLILNDLLCFALFAALKWFWLRHKGVSLSDRRSIFGNRQSGFSLQDLLERYPERILLIADGMARKGKHILVNIVRIILLSVIIKSPYLATQLLIVRGLLEVIVLSTSLKANQVAGPGGLFYGAMARIRDGAQARQNYLVSSIVSFIGYIWITHMIFVYQSMGVSGTTIITLGQFIYIPLAIGDALGEIIGSLWGKQNIRVIGIGEINKKSKMGTGAVFLGSLLPLAAIVLLGELSLPWVGLVLVVAVVSPIVEIAAPRSTDNFCIPAMNSLICLVFAKFWL